MSYPFVLRCSIPLTSISSRDSNPKRYTQSSSNLEYYLYSVPNVVERLGQGYFRTEKEYRQRAGRAIAEFERVFEQAN